MNVYMAQNDAHNRHGDLLKEAADQRLIRSLRSPERPAVAARPYPFAALLDRLLHRRAVVRS